MGRVNRCLPAAHVRVHWIRLHWRSALAGRRGGVLKNTGVFFEDCGSHTCAPSRAILGRPLPNPCCLIGHRVRRKATPARRWATCAAGRPAPFPQKGVGASGRPELVRSSSRRARDPKPRGRMNLALGRWVGAPPEGGKVRGVLGVRGRAG